MRRLPRTLLAFALGLILGGVAHADGVVEELSGAVDASPAGQEGWRRLQVGDRLAVGEVIRTGSNGWVQLRQGERVLELARNSRIRWQTENELRVENGRLAVEQGEGGPPLEIRTPHTRGQLRSGQADLRSRGPRDRWQNLGGSLAIAPGRGGAPVELGAGRQLAGDATALEASRPLTEARRGPRGRNGRRRRGRRQRREAAGERMREDLRWQDTLEKLVTASRRLVRRAESNVGTSNDEIYLQLEELGAALDTARARIGQLTEERALGTRPESRSAIDLAERAERAVDTHRSLSSRLERVRRPGPLGGRQAVGDVVTDAAPTGRPNAQVALARIQEAKRFLTRYQQPLRRSLRVLGRLVNHPPPMLPAARILQIQGRIVGGYRQGERLFLTARAEVQRVPRQEQGPQVVQRMNDLHRQWRAIGVQFRRNQDLVRRLKGQPSSPAP